MTKAQKSWMIFLIGLVVTLIAGLTTTSKWQEICFTFGLLTLIATLFSMISDKNSCGGFGWATILIGLAIMYIGGFVTEMPFVWLACGLGAFVFGFMVNVIKPEEPELPY